MTMSASRFLLLATGLWGSLSAAGPAKTLLWPSTFMGYEYDIANNIYDVTCVDEATWNSMTTVEFAAYDAIAIPDNGVCNENSIDFAVQNRDTWSAAVGGNIFVIGTSPELNYEEGGVAVVLENALNYVTSGSTTGLYVSLGCYYQDVYYGYAPIDVLGYFGTFAAASPFSGQSGCSANAHIMSSAVALAGLSDDAVVGYDHCSVSEVFRYYPTSDENWSVEAIATDATGMGAVDDDNSTPMYSGIPYILSRVAVSTGCNNGIYEPNYGEECDSMGTSTLCDSDCKCVYGVLDAAQGTCNSEPVCGNGILEGKEVCDQGARNGRLDSPCTTNCECTATDPSTQACIVTADLCGNGEFEPTYTNGNAYEQCDAGPDGNEVCNTGCQCIYGETNVPGECKSAPVCGDGNLEGDEQCERQLESRSLSLGKRAWSGDETCTDQCQCRYGFDTETKSCNPVPMCGNSIKEWIEECDAGLEGDALCTDTCTCIYGVDPDTKLCSAAPDAPATCGDGTLDEETEECDIALAGTDLCSPSCTCIYGVDTEGPPGSCLSRPTCGNGVVDDDEECDPYTISYSQHKRAPSNSLCSSTCTCLFGYDIKTASCNPVPVCGNSILEMNEECDAGSEGDDVCSTDCTCTYGLTEEKTCILPPSDDTTTTSSILSSTSTSFSSSSTTSSAVAIPTSSDIEPTTTPTSISSTQSSTTSRVIESTPSPATTTPVTATTPFSNSTVTRQSSSSIEEQVPTTSVPLPSEPASSSASASASSTADPLPATVGVFNFLGCTGSDQNYPSFSLELSSDEMDLELCTTACSDHTYAGVHTTNCYCADNFDNVVTVAKDLCSTPCPGNPAENCGGFREVSRLARRQATVPDNALLAVYVNPALLAVPSTTSTTVTTITTTAASTSSTASLAASNDPDFVSTTTALTTVVLATETVTAVSPGGTTTTTVCVGGYCNSGGYIFEICTGIPAAGEIVFVMEPCSCHGGYNYVPANCTGEACLGETVYKCVPFTGPTGSVIVYEPEPCDHCSGGVTFAPAPPAGGESTAAMPPATLVPSASDSTVPATGPATATSTLVVVAGSNKVIACVSSVLLAVGAFAVLL